MRTLTLPIPEGRLLIVAGLPEDANTLTIWTGQYSLRGYLKDRDYLFYTTNGVIKNVLLPSRLLVTFWQGIGVDGSPMRL